MELEPSGVPAFDDLMGGGLAVGDNIVWVGDDRELITRFAQRFLEPAGHRRRYVRLSAQHGVDEVPPGVEVIDGGRRRELLADPAALEAVLLEEHDAYASRLVVDGLDELILLWGAREAAAFYRQVCPRLFDLGVIAYWTGTRAVLSASIVDDVAKVAQCVFDVRQGRLRVSKAEGRPSRIQGAMVTVHHVDGELELSRQHAVGRLGEGLARLRRTRNLTQGQLARLAGVTPAAISQAEGGRRGLSLDTLLPLCEQLGLGLDDLLGGSGPPDYVLARRDRLPTGDPVTPLFEDPTAGPRAYLVRLEPGESGGPSTAAKGAELVLVAQGLVLVDLGHTTPVVRAGDAIMATRVPIKGWTNLGADPATLFLVLDG